MTFKSLLALTAMALVLPAAAQAETYTKTTTVSRISPSAGPSMGDYPDARQMNAMERMRARAAMADSDIAPGHVQTIYKGQTVTTTYVAPSAPVVGPNTWPTTRVYVSADETFETPGERVHGSTRNAEGRAAHSRKAAEPQSRPQPYATSASKIYNE